MIKVVVTGLTGSILTVAVVQDLNTHHTEQNIPANNIP